LRHGITEDAQMTRHLILIIGLLALLAPACSDDADPAPADAAVGDIVYYEPPVTQPVVDMPVYPDVGADSAATGAEAGWAPGDLGKTSN